MKRFFNSDDEDFGYFEDMDGEAQYISEEEYEELLERANELQEVQVRLAQFDLNQRLLADVMSMLQKSWFWNFKSTKAKLKEIVYTYKVLAKLTDAM